MKKLTNKVALTLAKVNSIEVEGVEYRFDVSSFKMNGAQIVNQMTVDGYIDGDWEADYSICFHIGDELTPDECPWLIVTDLWS